MPVINFDPRFEAAIREGWKTQTIRKPRLHPVRPGDILTLLTGQRTPECRRICHDVRCTDVLSIEIIFGEDGGIDRIVTDGVPVKDLDAFAVRDGFTDSDDMATFFKRMYGPLEVFHGFVIEWSMPTGRAAQVAAGGMIQVAIEFPELHPSAVVVCNLIMNRDPEVSLDEALFAIGMGIGIAMAARAGLGVDQLFPFTQRLTAGMSEGVDVGTKVLTEHAIALHGGRQ